MNLKPFLLVSLASSFLASVPTHIAQSQVSTSSDPEEIVSKKATDAESNLQNIDYQNAKPLSRLVKQRFAPAPTDNPEPGTPGMSPGSPPTVKPGVVKSIQLTPQRRSSNASSIQPQNFGTLNHPFTTARVATKSSSVNPATVFPYLPAGKLFFKIGGSSFLCSASVIKPRVIVTAAHCVSEFGKQEYYSDFKFIPGYTNGNGPAGAWTYNQVFVTKSYFNGTAKNQFNGVITDSDVAVLVMNDKNGQKIGKVTGTFGYGWNGAGYTRFLKKQTSQLTQLGYPVALDSGEKMQRNDSLSYIDENLVKNQIIGSLMTGGSSGGPWLVNFGIAPSASVSRGGYPEENVVVGVTSWGYTDSSLKEQGASKFTDKNIVPLVKEACAADPGNC